LRSCRRSTKRRMLIEESDGGNDTNS